MKQLFKKILVILVASLMVVTLAGCQKSNLLTIEKEENKAEGPFAGKTIILHTNDIHGGFVPEPDAEEPENGGLEGYATVSTMKKDFESKGANVILVDDGDFSQGSVYVSLNKGAAATTLMEEVGYDIVGLGNHEFDYGIDSLKSNFEGKSYKVICSNVFEDEKTLFDSEVVVKVGKLKIGFFGLLTPETQTKVSPNYVNGLTFTEKEDLYQVAQKEVDLLSKEVDLTICLAHLGDGAESIGNRSADVYANTTGIDFIIDGHSHSTITSGENGEPIQSTGSKCANVGVIIIDNATKTIESNYLVETKIIEADTAILDSSIAVMSKIDEEYGSIFANADVELNGVKEKVRSQETNMGDLVTDAMVWGILKEGSIEVPNEDVLAIINGGAIRNSIAKGGISMKDVNSVLPFGNTLAVDYINGSELLEALEASVYCTPETIGGFPQVSGIEFTIDTTKEFDAGEEYPDSTYCKPNSINRVTINSINGQPFDENKTYALITNDFMAAGGDTYYAFKRAYDAGNGFDTGLILDEVVVEYINEKLGGKISSEYENPQGRILIVVE